MTIRFCLAAFCFFAFTLPSASAERPKSNARKLPVYSTPKDCYEAMVKAGKSEDWATFLTCLTAADRNKKIGWIAYQVEREVFFQTKKRRAAIALLKKNGLEKTDIMGLMQIYDSPGGKGVAKAIELVGRKIKDQAQFVKEATVLLADGEEQKKSDGSKSDKPRPESPQAPSLSDVQIKGDRAVGKLQVPEAPKLIPIYFKKENGSWRVTAEAIGGDS